MAIPHIRQRRVIKRFDVLIPRGRRIISLMVTDASWFPGESGGLLDARTLSEYRQGKSSQIVQMPI